MKEHYLPTTCLKAFKISGKVSFTSTKLYKSSQEKLTCRSHRCRELAAFYPNENRHVVPPFPALLWVISKIWGRGFLWWAEGEGGIDSEHQGSGQPQAQQQLQSHPSQVEAKPSSKRGDSLQHLTSSRQTLNHLNSISGYGGKNQVESRG